MFIFYVYRYRSTLGCVLRQDNRVIPMRLSYRFHVFIEGTIETTRVNGVHENSVVQSAIAKLVRILNEKMLNIA